MKKHKLPLSLIFLCFVLSLSTIAQQKQALKGTVQRIKVHSQLLEGNLSGDSADRYVSVYLPPSYQANKTKRYPVVYFLHGYTDDDAKYYGFKKHWMILPPILDTAFVRTPSQEMIVVTPDAYTRFQGSMYSNSITTGNWEDFVAKELVNYIDDHYRTIAKKESRGLSGHSMGGYGAFRIGERNPDVFSAIYLLSPCCLNSSPVQAVSTVDSIRTIEQFQKAGFGAKILFASAAAWSPNPLKPPFYIDLPVKDGKLQQDIIRKWDANRPLNNLDQYVYNIKQLKALAFDAGKNDAAIAESIQTLDSELNKYGIKHFFEIYNGDHINRIAERIEKKMLGFFAENLSFGQTSKKK